MPYTYTYIVNVRGIRLKTFSTRKQFGLFKYDLSTSVPFQQKGANLHPFSPHKKSRLVPVSDSRPTMCRQVYQNRIKYNFPPLPPFISSVILRIASEPKRGNDIKMKIINPYRMYARPERMKNILYAKYDIRGP